MLLSGVMSQACAAQPADRFAESEGTVVYLSQNWTPAESVEFYGLRQGSLVLRRDIFNALEQPDGEALFRDGQYLASFGFLPQRAHAKNPDGYPVGLVGKAALEFNCAACHTSRITFGSKEYRIDGAQAMTDVTAWLSALVRAMAETLADAPTIEWLESRNADAAVPLDSATKFGRYAKRLLNESTATPPQIYAVRDTLSRELARRQRYNDYNAFGRSAKSDAERNSLPTHPPYGFGRIDALGAILNQACAEALHVEDNARVSNAPVNYPAVWDAPQQDFVQWNGAVDNRRFLGSLGRNAGQVVGVFGVIDVEGDAIGGYDSSVNFDSLRRAEELLTKLWSPLWPEEFGIQTKLVSAGQLVYKDNCQGCHAVMRRDDPGRVPHERLIPLNVSFDGYPALGTDETTAKNWSSREARVGPLAGRYETLPLKGRFPDSAQASVPARDVLSHVVVNIITRSFVPWRKQLTLEEAIEVQAAAPLAVGVDPLMRYKARPLNGVWSTAPYLHNGSVLNMVELLTAPAQRKSTFRIGTSAYEPSTMGFKDEGPFQFDATKPGNSNAGHSYGTDLTSHEKAVLMEYLKTI